MPDEDDDSNRVGWTHLFLSPGVVGMTLFWIVVAWLLFRWAGA